MTHSQELLDAPDGSGLTWIFDHCLRYPASYELPLRTMYALNCNPTRQAPPANRAPETAFCNRPSHSSNSSVSSQDTPLDRAADFRALLTHQIARLPTQPCSLPPSFVTSFLRRCFTPDLGDVDFPQALTGLDYLKDLETRRRKEVAAAIERLRLTPDDVTNNKAELVKKYPNVLTWLEANNAKNRKAEALYTQVYIGIRRWTLINEMLLEPHNKANCIAMLNTLFPPVTNATAGPTAQLTPQILKSQRDGFFRYIAAFENNGRQILDSVIAQGAPEGESTGWPLVRDALDKYLQITNDIIDDCAMVNDQSSLKETADSQPRRKVDSGISFASSDDFRVPSLHSRNVSEDVVDKPLPPAPRESQSKSGGSTLERLTRELRKLSDAGKVKNLKKMKSASALTARSESISSHVPDNSTFFEIDEQKRKRLIWEATSRKRTHSKQSSRDSQ
ncbi:hypothetical protein BDV25DRAFT_31958 [Aspergillus avenaceus]|uniref:HAUS augmin-like complex subunit 6 N-terminus-domain-containing protein n=1 Tax=Aspergillus avenaceus TaxID=36643 RepID=A0A5N6TMJ6_ASPAV|nr:hypothetical protein BDV25DRAFT_31958 [Aspergillus avenaceus]